MTIKVAIGYGGAKAEEVAGRLNTFLRDENLDVFFASPKSQDLLQGINRAQQKALIKKNFIESHVIVYVCHDGTSDRKAVKEEMTYIIQNNLNARLIIFSKSDECIPRRVKSLWHTLHFAPEKPEESFNRLLNAIYRQYVRLSEPAEIKLENRGV